MASLLLGRRRARPRARWRRAAAARGRAADRGRWPRAGRRRRGAAHPAAGGHVGDGRLCGARGRCRAACRPTLKLVGEVAAGRPFSGEVGAGEAARIFTGGVVPPGADTIVIQENTEARRRSRHRQHALGGRAAHPPRRPRFQAGPGAAAARQAAHRPRRDAGRRHEPSRAAGASPAQGRGAGDRRRAAAARQHARAGRDRLFQRLCADGAGAQRGRRGDRPRHRAGQGRGDRRGDPQGARVAAPTSW